ncbi:MAG: response regulator [Sandaracinaceae bacterium]
MTAFTCLIAEDSPMMRQLLVFALARIGPAAVTEAEDGIDALRKLAAAPGPFDLVIADINMPLMDGLKLIERIRADRVHAGVPIVVITTESSAEDRTRALALGADAYVTKPIQAPRVIELVKQLLGR